MRDHSMGLFKEMYDFVYSSMFVLCFAVIFQNFVTLNFNNNFYNFKIT